MALSASVASNAFAEETEEKNKLDDIEIIEVTGVRSSLTSALNAKKHSDSISDSIIAEEIGKSSDENIAQALSRISGVSLDRDGGDNQTITVRGVKASLNDIKLNGVSMTSNTDSQAVDLSLFSADILSRIDVIKSPAANQEEGSLGASMIKLISPLGPKIIGVNKKGNNVEGCQKVVTTNKIDSVLPEADILYLALPETPETKNIINRKRLNLLKPSCGIVNIGRQSAMDYDALNDKLKKNELAGAILDVFTHEPIESGSKFWDTPNLIITPHVSSDDGESYVRLTLELFMKNLELFINNKPLVNQVDKKLGY